LARGDLSRCLGSPGSYSWLHATQQRSSRGSAWPSALQNNQTAQLRGSGEPFLPLL
jgi:hypothetical protein